MSTTAIVTDNLTTLTDTGLTIARLDARLAALIVDFQTVFNLQVNIDPNAVDGQFAGIFAESINNLEMLLQPVYSSFDPAAATGAAQSRLYRLNGITRNLGSYSATACSFTGTAGTLIAAGSQIRSSTGNSVWNTLADLVLDDTGSGLMGVICTVLGPITAPAGTLTIIGTSVYGWQSVTNLDDAAPGSSQETDEAFRERQATSTATPSQGLVDSLQGSLGDITGVTQCVVYENPYGDVGGTGEAAADPNVPAGLPPHSVNCIVLGGLAQTIFNTIWAKKNMGPTLIGAQTGTITDSSGNFHLMKYDIPTPVPVFLVINVTRKRGWPTTGVAMMTAAIVAWANTNQTIGAAVIVSEIYTPINTIPGISVTALYAGIAPAPGTSTDLAIAFNAIATYDPTRITINLT